MSKPKFATTIIPEMWTDIDRVLAHVPRELDVLRIASCPAFAAAAKQHRALGVLQTMQGVCERYYLPLFFEVLRAASLRPLVPEKHAPAATCELDAAAWNAQYEVPWERPTERKRPADPTPKPASASKTSGTRRAK